MKKTSSVPVTYGIIAGGGCLPFVAANEIRAGGGKSVVAGLDSFASPDLADVSDRFAFFKAGHLRSIIDYFIEAGVTDVLLCGHIHHRNVFDLNDLDELVASILAQLDRRAESLLSAVVRTIESFDLRVIAVTDIAHSHIAKPGVLTRRQPDERQYSQLRFAWPIARQIAELNIGQSMVVRDGVILAVEAIEGTDAMIRRVADMDIPGGMMIKLPLKNKDPRFDLPVVGSATIKALHAAGIILLCIAAGKTIIIDPDTLVAAADEAGIIILAQPLDQELNS